LCGAQNDRIGGKYRKLAQGLLNPLETQSTYPQSELLRGPQHIRKLVSIQALRQNIGQIGHSAGSVYPDRTT
jgi:hypothetical protein